MPLAGQERVGKRGLVNSSVKKWLKDKAEYDDVERGLWRVHGKVYDFTSFVDSHPGGPLWLTRTKGQDITDFYETHHIDTSRTDVLLKKYFVCDQKIHPPQPFVYSSDNLYARIKDKVKVLAKNEQLTQSSRSMKLFVVAWCLLWVTSLAYLLYSNSWLAAVAYAYILYVGISIGHNYSHRNSSLGLAMDLTPFPRHLWTISHCLSHHTYTNLQLDLEIIGYEPFLYFLSSQPKNPKLALIYQYVVFALSGILLFVAQLIEVVLGAQSFRWEMLLLPAQFGLAYYAHGSSGLLMMMVAHAINSILFMQFTFPTHRSAGIWTEGDPNPNRDFAIHTLKTTADHSQGISLLGSLLLFQGFTDHVAHHLFPTVDRAKLPLITPLIREACQEMNLQHLYPTHHFRDILFGYFSFLVRSKPKVK